jgi:hypothetical protein
LAGSPSSALGGVRGGGWQVPGGPDGGASIGIALLPVGIRAVGKGKGDHQPSPHGDEEQAAARGREGGGRWALIVVLP